MHDKDTEKATREVVYSTPYHIMLLYLLQTEIMTKKVTREAVYSTTYHTLFLSLVLVTDSGNDRLRHEGVSMFSQLPLIAPLPRSYYYRQR